MALIKTSKIVSDIRGSFGGIYFSSDRSGAHIRSKPRRIKRAREQQVEWRNYFRKCVNLFISTAVTLEDKQRWQLFAAHGRTAFNKFVAVNIFRFAYNLEPFTSPPY